MTTALQENDFTVAPSRGWGVQPARFVNDAEPQVGAGGEVADEGELDDELDDEFDDEFEDDELDDEFDDLDDDEDWEDDEDEDE